MEKKERNNWLEVSEMDGEVRRFIINKGAIR